MENQPTVGGQFKVLNILHAALCAGILLLLCVFRYIVKKENVYPVENSLLLEITGTGIAFVSVLASRFLFFIRTKQAQSVTSLGEKINIFRAGYLVQMALLEGAAMTNIMLFYIGKNDLHFFIALGVLLLMIFRRPTRVMAAMVLFNPGEDMQQIYDDNLPV